MYIPVYKYGSKVIVFCLCWCIISILPMFQSKSLQNDASVLFSPPSIIKDTLPEEILEEIKSPPKPRNKKVL